MPCEQQLISGEWVPAIPLPNKYGILVYMEGVKGPVSKYFVKSWLKMRLLVWSIRRDGLIPIVYNNNQWVNSHLL